MSCDVCTAVSAPPKLIRYSLFNGRPLDLVDQRPAEVCDRCGEVTLSPMWSSVLQQTVWQREPPARFVESRSTSSHMRAQAVAGKEQPGLTDSLWSPAVRDRP